MAYKIFTSADEWSFKEAEYHYWCIAANAGYDAICWAVMAYCKHPTEDMWRLLIPAGHTDIGVELTDDWNQGSE